MTTRSRKPSKNASKRKSSGKASKKKVTSAKKPSARKKTTSSAKAVRKKSSGKPGSSLDRDQLLGIFRTMVLSREIDEEEIRLKAKGNIFFSK